MVLYYILKIFEEGRFYVQEFLLHTQNYNKGDRRKLWEVMNMFMFMALMMLMVSWVYTYLQTHRVLYIKCIQLFTCHLYPNKVVFKNIFHISFEFCAIFCVFPSEALEV